MNKRISLYLGLLFLGLLLIYFAQNFSSQRSPFFSQNQNPEFSVNDGFDYYTLVLSWSPTYCLSSEGRNNKRQCPRNENSKYLFVLHGLWPQYEKGYPERCSSSEEKFVPQEVVENMLDLMPSPRLIHHEYQKHGRCSGLSIKDYFKTSRDLFLSIHIPERYSASEKMEVLSLKEVKQDFLNQNPHLNEDSLFVSCSKGSNPYLKDVRICFSKDLVPRRCGMNERSKQLCSSMKVVIPPNIRGSRKYEYQ